MGQILLPASPYGFPLWGKLSPQVTDEGEICGCRQIPWRGGVTPPYWAIQICCAVGAGHAPPAILRQRQTTGQTAPMASPLWGKLSPQVTDEGATPGHFPLIRRVPRHLPPRGKAFRHILTLNSPLSTLRRLCVCFPIPRILSLRLDFFSTMLYS